MTKQQDAPVHDDPEDDPQVDVHDDGPLYEVLTESADGFRTVHRLRAADRDAAEASVVESVAGRVLGVSVAGCGLGSGDRPPV